MARRPSRSRPKTSQRKSVRYAVIGLGHIAQAAVLPAFKHAKRNSTLAALVSGEQKKLKQLEPSLRRAAALRLRRRG